MSRAALAALALGALACGRRAPIETCAAELAGAYVTETSERWMILDDGVALEVYPLFDDTRPPAAPPGLEIAPRSIAMTRTAHGADGEVRRRFGERGAFCVATAPAHLIGCAGDTLELVVADPGRCTASSAAPTHRERWRHE